MSRRCYASQVVISYFNYAAIINKMKFGNCFRAVFITWMIVQRFHQLIGRKAIDLSVINHVFPVVVFVKYFGVDSAEVNCTRFSGQARDQTGMIGMHMGDQKISFGKVNIQSGNSFLHGFPAFIPIETCIDNQIAVARFKDI